MPFERKTNIFSMPKGRLQHKQVHHWLRLANLSVLRRCELQVPVGCLPIQQSSRAPPGRERSVSSCDSEPVYTYPCVTHINMHLYPYVDIRVYTHVYKSTHECPHIMYIYICKVIHDNLYMHACMHVCSASQAVDEFCVQSPRCSQNFHHRGRTELRPYKD
jgi:hypothetical protein